jgi:hypothetical protein
MAHLSRVGMAVVAFALSGCDSITPRGDQRRLADEQPNMVASKRRIQTELECARAGGNWRKACIAQIEICVMPHHDAGKKCRNSSECEGRCVTDLTAHCDGAGRCTEPAVPNTGDLVTGMCQRDDAPCGTFIEIKDGRAQPAYHID